MSALTKEHEKILALVRHNPIISNKEIAEKLQKSPKTLESQFTNIYKRLGIKGDQCQKRIQLVLYVLGIS